MIPRYYESTLAFQVPELKDDGDKFQELMTFLEDKGIELEDAVTGIVRVILYSDIVESHENIIKSIEALINEWVKNN